MNQDQLIKLRKLFTSFGMILGGLTENVKAPLKYDYDFFTRLHDQALKDFDDFYEATKDVP